MTRAIIMAAGAAVALGFLAGSAVANFMFGMSLGRTFIEGILFGSIGVCAVVTNALCPFYLSWFIQASRRSAVAGTMLLYALCLIYSVTSAVGLAAQNREGVTTAHQITRDAYEDTRRELLDLENRRSAAKGRERTRLDARIDDVRRRLRTLQSATPVPADAQSTFLSALSFGLLDPQRVRLTLVALFALMVEVGATIGLFVALSHPTQQPAPPVGRWRPRVD